MALGTTTRTFAGAKIAVSSVAPATYDATGYAALTWTAEHCIDAVPVITKKFNAVTKSTTCTGTEKDIKGSSKYDPVGYKFDPVDSRAAETIYQTAFDSQNAVISVRVSFAKRGDGETTPDTIYFTAQVAKLSETAGGKKDDIDMRDVELWIQRDIVRQPGDWWLSPETYEYYVSGGSVEIIEAQASLFYNPLLTVTNTTIPGEINP